MLDLLKQLFRGSRVDIHSITIPNFGWPKTDDTDSVIKWINTEQTAVLSVNFFPLPPDLPTLKADELRLHHRASLAGRGALIEVENARSQELRLVRTIFKVPQAEGATIYVGALTIPFETCSFVVKIQAVETSPTGLREAVIVDRLLAEGSLSIGDEGLIDWQADPYDQAVVSDILMNRAEAASYDAEFPDHPLTIVRQALAKLESELRVKPEILKLPAFNK